jgi:hypothetical protein
MLNQCISPDKYAPSGGVLGPLKRSCKLAKRRSRNPWVGKWSEGKDQS